MKFSFRSLVLFAVIGSWMMVSVPTQAAVKSSISIPVSSINLVPGQVKVLTAKVVNGKGYPVVWKTNRGAVATVTNGSVKAVGLGKALITATIPKLNLISKPVTVTVTKKVYANAQAIFEQVNKSIVYVESYNKYGELVGSGSGIIISADGQVVTNYHVVTDYSEITRVKMKLATGKAFVTAKAIGFDVSKDLVLLKFDTKGTVLPVAALGDSTLVATGEKVYALGSPKGVQNTITEGIVSNRNVVLGKNAYIQTNASMSPGNSGGALVNKYGEVIGINDLSLKDAQSMNYAIPINVFKAMPKNKNLTLLQVNQASYVPASGKGNVTENENNNTADYADKIPYADAVVYGTISTNNDVDYFYFEVTSNTSVSFFGVTEATELSSDLELTIIDDMTGDTMVSELTLGPESQVYYPALELNVPPGSYSIKVAVKAGSTNTFTNTNYGLKVDLTTLKITP